MLRLLCLPILTLCTHALAATNTADGRTTIILSTAPSNIPYYTVAKRGETMSIYNAILLFQITFAKLIRRQGSENVVLACDKSTCDYIRKSKLLPKDILWEAGLQDVWLRDYGRTPTPTHAAFKYQPTYVTVKKAFELETALDKALNKVPGYKFPKRSPIILSGSNIVYNQHDKAVMTDRVAEDNKRSYKQTDHVKLFHKIKNLLGVQTLSIIPEIQDTKTGNAAELLTFVDDNTILMQALPEDHTWILTDEVYDARIKFYRPVYESAEEAIRTKLQTDFPDINIVTLPYQEGEQRARQTRNICGNFLEILSTRDVVYMPRFGTDPRNIRLGYDRETDTNAFWRVKGATTRKVVQVPLSNAVCRLGGGLRAFSSTLTGQAADALVKYVEGQSSR